MSEVTLNPLECALDEAQAFRRQVDALRAENAKLREENERFIIKLNAEHIVRQNVEAENAKLREMVRSVLVLRHDTVCKWLDATFAEVFGKSFTEQAHELGIEVGGEVLHGFSCEFVQEGDSCKLLDTLLAENATLRDDRFRKCWHEQVQNAKLRQLVRHMYECMCNIDADGNHECDSCEYDNIEDKCDFERLMRELGVSDGRE